MRRFSRCILIVFAVGVLLALPYACLAQNPGDTAVALKRLSPPVYPAIALTAHVEGDVELLLQVRMDGSVESATVVSGPPLLLRASLSSAQQSQFNCLNCVQELTPYRLVYTYRIDSPPDGCKGPDPCHYTAPGHPTELSQSENHTMITGHPSQTCICDYLKRVRSVKCLYLWKCGLR